MIFYIAISYVIWVSRNLDSLINIHTSNVVNWYRNRTTKTTASYILLLNMADDWIQLYQIMQYNRPFGMLRCFWQYLFHMQYENEGDEISYQNSHTKHTQLIAESTSENCIIVFLVVWTRRQLNSTVLYHAKQLKNLQNCRIRNTLHVMQRTI